MPSGFFSIYYTGKTGSGFGVIVLHDGKIHGADVTGGNFRGKFTVEGDTLQGSLELEVPANQPLVTGKPGQPEPYIITIPLSMPINLGNGAPMLVRTPTGPINVSIKHLAPWQE